MASDLSEATRELFVRSLKNQVFIKMPFYEELERRGKITFTGGKYIERLVDYAETDSTAQTYSTNTALTNQPTDTLKKPRFTWKKMQVPSEYDCDIEIQNVNAGNEEQLLDLSKYLADKAHRAARLKMMRMAFNSGSNTGVADGATDFQSLVSALDHDVTYGTLSRSWSGGTNDWWQGADPSALDINVSSSTQGDAFPFTAANLRKWIGETTIAHYMESEDDLSIFVCPSLWNKLAAELEAKVQYKPVGSQNVRQGVRKMEFDGHQVVSVPELQRSSTMQKWVFILNMNCWELRLSTARNFKMTDYEWQGKYANGYDYYLARILVAGNTVCWQPNSSMWLSNVT